VRTEAGHRLYDAARLQRVESLGALEFTLKEIRGCLNRPDFPPHRVIDIHLSRLRERIEPQQSLCEELCW
jgi:DNA-binding transcriptional MerR regulator